MAPFSNYISFLFFTALLLPLQIIARESQFFSKVTHFNNNNNVKEAELPNPNKDEQVTNKPEQQPAFIPETENSYGLYGHDDESAQLPSPTTTTNQPLNTEFEDTSKYPNNKHSNYYNNDAYNTRLYNKDALGNDQNELTYTKEGRGGYNTPHIGNNQNELSYSEEGRGGYNSPRSHMGNQNNKQEYYFNNNNAANERHYYSNNNNNNYAAVNNRYNNVEKQGMSDTRFLEGGKYFYDMNNEKYNPTHYDDSYRGVNTNNWYNNRGNNNYGNNNKNAYQNQEEFEDEQNEFEP
ncbi:protein E6-like [Lotus japonicus]|uniref:protein E6-like n=1 Tax=Lotus japonicus TaxID=34305 RepID=UPI002585DAD8|nr:protein E6-like [Lotus japonicus]